MKFLVFILWILVYVQVKQCELVPTRVYPERIRSSGEALSITKRDDPRPKAKGWLWCAENSTFASKPCPGDPQLEECLLLTNVSRKDVSRLMKGKWRDPPKSVKKWVLCYLSKNGIMSLAGVLRQDEVLRNIPDQDKAMVEKTINKCLYKSAHDPVETAWHYLTCFRSKQPKYAKIANSL
nr:uncharacterized protein LOC117992333 [Maniola hyperantus]